MKTIQQQIEDAFAWAIKTATQCLLLSGEEVMPIGFLFTEKEDRLYMNMVPGLNLTKEQHMNGIRFVLSQLKEKAQAFIFVSEAYVKPFDGNYIPKTLHGDPEAKEVLMVIIESDHYNKTYMQEFRREGKEVILLGEPKVNDTGVEAGALYNVLGRKFDATNN